MNSNSLQYNKTANAVIEIPALPRKNNFIALARTVINWFAGSSLEQARGHYRVKRERAAQGGSTQDIVNSLSLDDKQRLGLYRLMD